MDKKTILVVMPVYNAEKTLESAIRSVLRQRYNNLHLVVVDDASTDGSLEIAKKFLNDPRFSLYSNKKNMGAYYCRNYGLYAFKDRSWGYFTTHDADDISYENRYSSLIRFLDNRTNAIQDTFIRKRLDTNETINSELTMAHAIFTKQVFRDIGYFDNTRFGGDWEHWERLKQFNKINKSKTVHHKQALGESYIHDQNLTVLIPIGSKKRKKYIEVKRKEIQEMIVTNNFFRNFVASSKTSEIKFEGMRMSKPKELAPRVAVIVLTWKRVGNIKNTLSDLSKQTFKDFTVYISNGDMAKAKTVEKYAMYFKNQFDLNVKVRHDGNEFYAFRRLMVAKELAEAGTEIIFYIDDDVSVPSDYIQTCLSQYQEKTYHSGFAWTLFNNGENYYNDRERRWDNDYRIYYCGTGVSMIDAKIFLDPKLSDPLLVPEGALKVEDLWLSYYADHILKWKLRYIEMPGVQIGGADSVALYKRILNEKYTKADFLKDLVKMGWKIPKDPVKA